ncbi:MAG: S8 family serine peptidase [Bacteroidales bacterium]|nr:S8 family serine peptidase [Bacteroidales bacterium]
MNRIYTWFFWAFFAMAILPQTTFASDEGIFSPRLIEKLESAKGDEMIRINIFLKEKFDSQELIQNISTMRKDDRRAYVIEVLKDFSSLTQKGVLSKLSDFEQNRQVSEVTSLWINNVINCYATPEAIMELSTRSDIEQIDYDEYRVVLDPNERKNAFFEEGYSGNREITWNVLKVNAQLVWALGYDGEGVIVSVIDTGVNYNHVDLVNNVWENPEFPFHGYNFVSNNNNPMDDHGHGTHCAGTVAGDGTAGSQTGVAPGATIMCLKVLDAGGGGNESSVWAAVQFSVEHGANVMSLSLGWQHSWGPNRTAFRQAFDNGLAAGLIASVAAGNEGNQQGSYPIPDNVRTPGDCPPPWLHPDQTLTGGISSVVCVGATNSSDVIAGFSSRGPLTWSTIAPYNDYAYQPGMGLIRPDLCAPGVGIKSLAHYSNTGYESGWDGTSMATPAVAGVMALMLQKNNLLEPAEMNQILEETALVLQPGKNNTTGSGRVDALAAVEEVTSVARPTDLVGAITFETGEVQLSWQFEPEPGFEYFKIYRDNLLINTTTDLFYSETLPEYGIYEYKVTAQHETGESNGPKLTLQWGDAHIGVTPEQIVAFMDMGATLTEYITVENTGQLDLIYEVSSSADPVRKNRDYCIPTTNCSFGDGFTGFAMGDISNMNSGCSPNGYGDFTNMSTEIQAGETYDVTLKTGYDDQYVTIWIDFNKNETFDPSEMVLNGFLLANANQNYIAQVTIPEGAESGETRMRAKANWQSATTDPCESTSYGETEDYTVNVSGWLYVQRVTDTIAPGASKMIEVLFDSQDLTAGVYYGNVKVASNDPDLPEVDVPVTLNVGGSFPLALTVNANPSAICLNESSQLTANVTGGTGAYTYLWTSLPAGFTSTLPNPSVSPDETTVYYVEVNDGETTINGETTVVVNHTPEIAGTPQGINSICWGTTQSVFTSSGAQGSEYYIWTLSPASAGTITGTGLTATVDWSALFTGSATVSVNGANSCGNGQVSLPLNVTIHALPQINLGDDMEVCANESVMLDAGNPGATYLWSTGETTQTIVVDTTGVGIGVADFWVQVTDVNSCSNIDNISIEFKDCTGISDVSDKWLFNIYPNPSTGVFDVRLQTIRKQDVSLVITDTFGKEVFRNNKVTVDRSSSIGVDLRHLAEGVYLLRLTGDGINMTQKIIINK